LVIDKLDILLVDSNPKVATAFRLALRDVEPKHVLSIANSFAEIGLQIKKKNFDLFVLGFNYQDSNGFEDITRLIETYGPRAVLALLSPDQEQQAISVLTKGASEVLFVESLVKPLIQKSIYCAYERFSQKVLLGDYIKRFNLSEKRFADVQQLSGLGHIELDVLTNQMTWSDEVYRIFEVQIGSNAPNLKEMLQLLPSDDRLVLEETIAKTTVDGQVHQCEVSVFVKGNKIKQIRCQVKLIFNTFSQKYNVVITLKDITHVKLQQEQAFEARLGVLNNQLLEKLLSDLGSRVRRPLSSVLNFAYLLKQTPVEKLSPDAFDGLAISVNELLESINNLLNFTIVRGGHIQPLRQKLNIEAFLDDLIQFCALRASTKDIVFESENQLQCPEGLVGDLRLLSQLLYNFILHSITHAKNKSHVSLNIEWVLVQPYRKLITFTLKDDAAPYHLTPERLQALEEIEVSDVQSIEHDPNFHLIIVLKILKLMGGQLGFTRKAKSNVLTLKIEMDVVDHSAAIAEGHATNQALRILIAEDHSMNQLALKKLLGNWKPNAQIVLADNGQQALDHAKSQDFDLVLMDLQMPVLDGFEAFKEISVLKQIPTIALSASSNDSERIKCIQAGFKAYIEKPYKPEQLFNLIDTVLSPV
jgi:CheY-like chemotaxis protein